MQELLRLTSEREQVEFLLTVSLVEIYCDRLVDLLSDLPLRDQTCGIRGGSLRGLTARTITTAEEIHDVLAEGSANRKGEVYAHIAALAPVVLLLLWASSSRLSLRPVADCAFARAYKPHWHNSPNVCVCVRVCVCVFDT